MVAEDPETVATTSWRSTINIHRPIYWKLYSPRVVEGCGKMSEAKFRYVFNHQYISLGLLSHS